MQTLFLSARYNACDRFPASSDRTAVQTPVQTH